MKSVASTRLHLRASTISLFLVLAWPALIGAAAALFAQAGHRVVVGLMPMSGSTSLATRSGAVGSKIWIRTANLPPRTEVQVMMGALRDGFEVVTTRITDESGRFEGMDSVQVEVPRWVKHDRPYLVIVTDPEYRPLGSADMFHPTDSQGALVRSGRVGLSAASCPVLTGEADEIYFLIGVPGGLESGDRVRVVGRPVETSECGKGSTIRVERVERLAGPQR